MSKSTFKLTVNNTKKVKKLMDGKKQEILEEVGKLVSGEAQLRVPVDTGNLKQSIADEMKGKDTVLIGTDVEYSDSVEFGTSLQVAQPYLLPAYEQNKEEIKEIMRKRYAELGGG